MAITSRTAAARAQPQPQTVGGELATEALFQFIDFTFSDEENENRPVMDITEAATMGGFSFEDLPSPVPLCEINLNGKIPTYHPALHPTSSGVSQINEAKVIALDDHRADEKYNSGLNTTTCPKPEDVLSVRGVGHSKNPGNLRFRELVNAKKSAYEGNANSEFRRSLAVDIVTQLHPGRFLKKADPTLRVYQIMDYESSVTKALFAIRDVKKPSGSRAQPSSSSLTKGKRKRKAPAKSQKKIIEQPLDRGRRRKISYTTNMKEDDPPAHILTGDEEKAIEKMIDQGMIEYEPHILRLGRSTEIYKKIEAITLKGAQVRKKMGENWTDQGWFQPERQKEIKKHLLKRCKAAMKTGMSFTVFFDKLDESIFGSDL